MDFHIFAGLAKRLGGPALFCLLFQMNQVNADIPASLNHVKPEARIIHAANDAELVSLKGNRLAVLDSSQDQGPVNDGLRLEGLILNLNPSPRQQQALTAFNAAQLTPGSADYHHWLSPEEFASSFGVASEDLLLLKNYLLSKGFQVDETASDARSIVFGGSVAQLRNTFHTEIHQFQWKGEKHIANISDPQIPAAFADLVSGLVNLHDFYSHSSNHWKLRQNATVLNRSLPADYLDRADIFPITNYDIGGSNYLLPGDYAVIYDINPLYRSSVIGTGYTIAVLGRSNVLTTDITSFQSLAGQKSNPPNIVITNTNPGYVSGDQLESSLDLEWATGVATGATIKFVTSASTQTADGIQLSAKYAVQNNVGDVISLSYSNCEASMGLSQVIYWGSLWSQAQTQGQTVLVASGDSGAADCDADSSSTAVSGAAVNGLCSSPYSTCVGGTQFNDTVNSSQYWSGSNSSGNTTALGYIPESVWNASSNVSGGSFLYASGGGQSIYWSKPGWQVSPGVLADGVRDVPDVAMTTSLHDGYLMYMNGAEYIAGGTSAATPSLAGVMALMLQYNGGRQGNINSNLYGLNQLQVNGGYSYFHATVSGNNSVPGQTGFSANGSGYNLATGLGSVDANLLIRHWTDLSNINSANVHAALAAATEMLIPANANVTLSSSSAVISAGQTISLMAKVSGDAPSGSVEFMSGSKSLGTVTLNNGVAVLSTNGLTAGGGNALSAIYSGDANNMPNSSAVLTEIVLALPTVTVSSSASSVTSGQNVTLTATVTGSSPTGTVQFYINGQLLGSAVPLVNGVAVLSAGLNITGQDTITANYSGDSRNIANTSAGLVETVVSAQPQQVPALPLTQEMILAILLLLILIWVQRIKSYH
jgi:subtilase family serine protease